MKSSFFGQWLTNWIFRKTVQLTIRLEVDLSFSKEYKRIEFDWLNPAYNRDCEETGSTVAVDMNVESM